MLKNIFMYFKDKNSLVNTIRNQEKIINENEEKIKVFLQNAESLNNELSRKNKQIDELLDKDLNVIKVNRLQYIVENLRVIKRELQEENKYLKKKIKDLENN